MKYGIAIATVLSLMLVTSSQAAEIEFYEGGSPDASYNADFQTGKDGWFPPNAGLVGDLGGIYRAWANFDISAIPALSTIDSVEFTLREVTGGREWTVPFDLHAADAYVEGGPYSFGDMPAPGDLLTSLPAGTNDSVGLYYNWASTPEFVAHAQAALDGDGVLSFLIKASDESAGVGVIQVVDDSQGDKGWGAGNTPKLTVNYTPIPEPASMALLGVGGLLILRRRRA